MTERVLYEVTVPEAELFDSAQNTAFRVVDYGDGLYEIQRKRNLCVELSDTWLRCRDANWLVRHLLREMERRGKALSCKICRGTGEVHHLDTDTYLPCPECEAAAIKAEIEEGKR